MNNSNDQIPKRKSEVAGNPLGMDDTTGFQYRDLKDPNIQEAWDPNDGQFFLGNPVENTDVLQSTKNEPKSRNSQITKVDGVKAYSQVPSLYPGMGIPGKFHPQLGLVKETGKMPPGALNPEPWKEYVERNKFGFKNYPRDKYGRTPPISPYPSNVEDSTAWDFSVHTTIRDLKGELGVGMGARTNKYILELDIPTVFDPGFETLNILCQATSFPARSMNVATVWRMGRKYNLRGEVDYGGSWTLTFVEDSNMSVRKALDAWHVDIDDSTIQREALNNLYDLTENKLMSRPEDLRFSREQSLRSPSLPAAPGYGRSLPNYQTDIKVFQLDQVGNRIMGYLLQNAFISGIEQTDYADDQLDTLTKTTCTITFSEFMILSDHTMQFDIKKQF